MTTKGHDDRCSVFKLAPDGGPSQRECDCRPLLGSPECTGTSASWCPVHGDCTCDRQNENMEDPECPLHSRDSTHAVKNSLQKYVLGFCFSHDCSKVVLIAKTRPPWQAGKLNGLGGKVEPGESPAQAMDREFRTESGCWNALDWEPFGRLRGADWEVWLFHAHYQCLPIFNLCDEGTVAVHHTLVVLTCHTSQEYEPLPNLRYLIPMALNHIGKLDRAEFLDVLETTCPLTVATP